MELFFDTETSGFINKTKALDDLTQSWICQIAMILSTEEKVIGVFQSYIFDDDREMSKGAYNVHKIGPEITALGLPEFAVAPIFKDFLNAANLVVAHNYKFDWPFVRCLLMRTLGEDPKPKESFCTMEKTTNLLKLRKPNGPGYKWPKLEELYQYLFDIPLTGAHNAMADTLATKKCYYELKKRGEI